MVPHLSFTWIKEVTQTITYIAVLILSILELLMIIYMNLKDLQVSK